MHLPERQKINYFFKSRKTVNGCSHLVYTIASTLVSVVRWSATRPKNLLMSALCTGVGKFSIISSIIELSSDSCGRCSIAVVFRF